MAHRGVCENSAHRAAPQNDLIGFLGQQYQVFLAFVLDAIQILKIRIYAVLVGEGQDVALLFFLQDFFGCHNDFLLISEYDRSRRRRPVFQLLLR